MENITPKYVRYAYEAYKTYSRIFDEIKDDLKKHLKDIEPKLDLDKYMENAFEKAQQEKTPVKTDKNIIFYPLLNDAVMPVGKRTRYSIEDFNTLFDKAKEKTYELGYYSLLPTTDLAKKFGIKTKNSYERVLNVHQMLPKVLQNYSNIESLKVLTPTRMKIEFDEFKEIFEKFDFLKEAYKKMTTSPSLEDMEEFVGKLKMFYERFKPLIREDNEYFKFSKRHKIKIPNFSFSEMKYIKDYEELFTFKPSSKKIREFVNKNNIKNLEEYGLNKEESYIIYSSIKNKEELKPFLEWVNSPNFDNNDFKLENIINFNKLVQEKAQEGFNLKPSVKR